MARNLKALLPPGTTGFLHGGQVYVPDDDGKVTDINGKEVELPADFPSDDQLEANLTRASTPGSQFAPLTKAADGRQEEPESGQRKGRKAGGKGR